MIEIEGSCQKLRSLAGCPPSSAEFPSHDQRRRGGEENAAANAASCPSVGRCCFMGGRATRWATGPDVERLAHTTHVRTQPIVDIAMQGEITTRGGETLNTHSAKRTVLICLLPAATTQRQHTAFDGWSPDAGAKPRQPPREEENAPRKRLCNVPQQQPLCGVRLRAR
jgi:hypothetical protein